MPARRILQLGDPMLRQVSAPVADPSQVRLILRDLDATLAGFRRQHGFGRGISAIQIGEPVRVIFCEVGGAKYELINPQFTQMSDDTFWLWDDCFSFPNLLVWLERARRVRLRYQTTGGATRELEAEAAMAELLQHEMDHLDGVLAVDHARGPHSLSTRTEWLRRKGAPPETPVHASRQGLG